MSSIFWANGVCPVVVGGHGTQQSVGQDEDLARDGDEGDFTGLAARLEGGVEGFHGGAVADGGDGGLVQCDPDFAASAADVSDAVGGAAVVGEGSQADEGGDGLSRTLSEFGQVHQEGTGHLGADADDGLQDGVFGFERFGVGDDAIHAAFEILDLFFEEGDDLVDIAKDFW